MHLFAAMATDPGGSAAIQAIRTAFRGWRVGLAADGRTAVGMQHAWSCIGRFSQSREAVGLEASHPVAANFPDGVRYPRNADFPNRRLLGKDGVTVRAASIDPLYIASAMSHPPAMSTCATEPRAPRARHRYQRVCGRSHAPAVRPRTSRPLWELDRGHERMKKLLQFTAFRAGSHSGGRRFESG
jgi:hypothetical protein